MANQPVALIALPGGGRLWFGDVLPILTTDGGPYVAGDFFWNTALGSNVATLFKCVTSSVGTTTPAAWIPIADGNAAKVVTGATVATVQDEFILMTTASAYQVQIPQASAANFGKQFYIKRQGAANGTVLCLGTSPTLEAGTTATFGTDLASLSIISDGTQWRVIGTYGTVNFS